MNINIEVHYQGISGSKIEQRGSFPVNKYEFEKDQEFTAAVAAYKFIEQIRKQHNYLDMTLEKVIYDGNNDITKVVKQIRPIIDDDLPF